MPGKSRSWLRLFRRLALFATLSILLAFVSFLALRIWESERGPPLEAWHLFVPTEMTAAEIDHADWAAYLTAEQRVFDEVRTNVVDKMPADQEVPANRYFSASAVNPARFADDWNRSHLLLPAGSPKGAVVLLHGLTDSPYSMRHLAGIYVSHGYVAIIPRLPAHGTVPAALTAVHWEDWMAATRLAVREARRLSGPGRPLHIVGFSNGGALALKYALDANEDRALARPDRLILLSPMIGITSFARYAGLAGLPAILPAFAKAAWLSILPEFIPFKYNSFPVNGARQSYEVTQVLQAELIRQANADELRRLAPILTFQSVVDSTVSTAAVIRNLYALLPPGSNELVLFDLNRSMQKSLFLNADANVALDRLLPSPPRNFRTSIITNASPTDAELVERRIEADSVEETIRRLDLAYPQNVFSLSHVALPFPVDDPLYGSTPANPDEFGINLGSIMPRGERGVFVVSLDALFRITSNPLFPYVRDRIDAELAQPSNR
nr:alpha/beta hydrolase [Arboricoccus pini]